MGMGYPVKVSGVTDAFKQNYVIPCPKVCVSILNFDHGRSPYISYVPEKTDWKYMDFGSTSTKVSIMMSSFCITSQSGVDMQVSRITCCAHKQYRGP
jgi:hypothetical protein